MKNDNNIINYKIQNDIANNNKKININKLFLPITIYQNNLSSAFYDTKDIKKVLAIVIGTKPDFYKQAPLLLEAKERKVTFLYNIYRSTL